MLKQDKNNETALRILEVLKILLQEEVTKHELIDKLKKKSNIDGVYTQEAFIKYFNTIEAAGFKIDKDGRRYKISNSLNTIKLTPEEVSLLLKLLDNSNRLYNKNHQEVFYNILRKLEKYTGVSFEDKIKKAVSEAKTISEDNAKSNILATLSKYINEGQLLSIIYKKSKTENEKVIVELKNVIEKNNKIYLVCYNRLWTRNKRIPLDSIIKLEQLSQKSPQIKNVNTVIFEVYGRLVKSYKLKPSEEVIDYSKECLTISNKEEDKDSILLRLLKYGENCKIIKPLSYKKEFISLTNSILKNLEEK